MEISFFKHLLGSSANEVFTAGVRLNKQLVKQHRTLLLE